MIANVGATSSTTSGSTDLAAMASGAGIACTGHVRSEADVVAARLALLEQPGPVFFVADISPEQDSKVLPPIDGAFLAHRFRAALGVEDQQAEFKTVKPLVTKQL